MGSALHRRSTCRKLLICACRIECYGVNTPWLLGVNLYRLGEYVRAISKFEQSGEDCGLSIGLQRKSQDWIERCELEVNFMSSAR